MPLIIGLVAGALALCLVCVCAAALGGVLIFKEKDSPQAHRSPASLDTSPTVSSRSPRPPTSPAPRPAPVRVGDCIVVNEQGHYVGIGNCNGTRGTYRVLSLDRAQHQCADPDSPYTTVDGYRLCLELYLVRTFCYKLPEGRGWVVAASACKAKGTVHVIDIVPGASNGDRCTRDRQWNRWYRYEHPVVVYCVMQY